MQKNKLSPEPENSGITLKRFFNVVTVWFPLGAFAGFITAGEMEVLPDSWIPYVIGAFFVVTFAKVGVSLADLKVDIDHLVKDTKPENLKGNRALARVGKLEEAGVTVSSFNHMFIFTLTVFPQMGSPYETNIRQFITMGELPNYYTGRFVVFAEDADNPGYGFIDKEPSEYWQQKMQTPPEEWKTYKAAKSYPDKKITEGLLAEELPKMTPMRWALNIVLIPTLLVLGFLFPFYMSEGGMEVVKGFFS